MTACSLLVPRRDLATLPAVSVSAVAVPDKMVYEGFTGALMDLPLYIGSEGPEALQSQLKAYDFDVATIVRDAFINSLQRDPRFTGKLRDSAGARFEVKVESYGLRPSSMNSSEFHASLVLKVTLRDAGGAVLWQQTQSHTMPGQTLQSAKLSEYVNHPSSYRDALVQTTDSVTRVMLHDIH